MTRKSKRTPKQPTGDPKDPKGMIALMEQFCEWMQVRNYSEKTVEARQQQVVRFIDWAAARGVMQPGEVTKPIVERYQRFLYHYRSRKGNPQQDSSVTVSSQHRHLAAADNALGIGRAIAARAPEIRYGALWTPIQMDAMSPNGSTPSTSNRCRDESAWSAAGRPRPTLPIRRHPLRYSMP